MNFFHTTVTPQAIESVRVTLESTYLSEGSGVNEFERRLNKQLGLSHPVCVNSGTSALHLALVVAGVKPGDEVITSPQTFVATALVIKYCGATPVFADIDPHTGNVTVESIKTRITPKTRAILPVMWAGYPVDLALSDLAYQYGLRCIVDAAQGLGASYHGIPIGAWGQYDLCCYSFQATKLLTTGDGGCITSNDSVVSDAVRKLRWFGIDRIADLPDELGERQYELHDAGFKYHMNDLAAACGLGNLVGFEKRLARRREIASRYFLELANVSGLTLMNYQPDRESAYWLFPVLVEQRLEFVRKLKECGVPTSVVHSRIDKHPIFGNGIRDDLVGQAFFDKHQIHIPINDALSNDDVDLIINSIQGGW